MRYRVRMEVGGLDAGRSEAVKEGLRSAWDFSEITEAAGTVFCFGEGELDAPPGGRGSAPGTRAEPPPDGGGDDVGPFVDRLVRLVWEAHGGYCQVATMVAREGGAFSAVERGREDYARLAGGR